MKYPRTYHLPWSPGASSDDKIIDSIAHLLGKTVVITEKLDGENTSMFSHKIHARSEDSRNHPSRSWVKGLWGELSHRIPINMQICGENMYAKHSIYYDRLSTYFYGFALFVPGKVLSWEETLKVLRQVGIEPVPTLYIGPFTEGLIRELLLEPKFKAAFGDELEGYVVRPVEEFNMYHFDRYVLKYVRKDHVQTDVHWINKWEKNGLRK